MATFLSSPPPITGTYLSTQPSSNATYLSIFIYLSLFICPLYLAGPGAFIGLVKCNNSVVNFLLFVHQGIYDLINLYPD